MSPVEPEVSVDDDHVARVEVPLHPARAHARTLGGRLQEPGLRATDLGLQIFFGVFLSLKYFSGDVFPFPPATCWCPDHRPGGGGPRSPGSR